MRAAFGLRRHDPTRGYAYSSPADCPREPIHRGGGDQADRDRQPVLWRRRPHALLSQPAGLDRGRAVAVQ